MMKENQSKILVREVSYKIYSIKFYKSIFDTV